MTDRNWQFDPEYDYPAFSGKRRTYVIAASPRSGSNLLGHLLKSTGVLGSPFEYFHDLHAQTWMPLLGVSDFQSMIKGIQARRTSPSGWFGVKSHWFQFAPIAASEQALRFLDIERYIEIRRRDRLGQAISWALAEQTNAWISFQQGQAEPKYDFAHIRRTLSALDTEVGGWNSFFAQHDIKRQVVFYEDLTQYPRECVSQILQSFGLADGRIETDTRLPARQASDINQQWRERFMADLARENAGRPQPEAGMNRIVAQSRRPN